MLIRVGIEPSRLAEPSEPAELTRAEPKISESRAERARGLARSLAHRAMNEPSQERADPSARSLGSLFCNIHFVSNSIKLRQLYVTEFATDENQFFQPIKYELGKVLCMFLCLSRCVFHCGFLRPTLEFRFFIFFFLFFISAVLSLISIILIDNESIFLTHSI